MLISLSYLPEGHLKPVVKQARPSRGSGGLAETGLLKDVKGQTDVVVLAGLIWPVHLVIRDLLKVPELESRSIRQSIVFPNPRVI